MIETHYPNDVLIKSEGEVLNRLLRFKTTLEHLQAGAQPTDKDMDNCIEALTEAVRNCHEVLYPVAYNKMK